MAPSTTVRRLLRETLELSASTSNPNPSFQAHPVSDENLFEWHFTLLGPPSPSPYAGGLYHGRISLPLSYPLKPPNFRFLTPSGRFEVNREICLSISGFHEESWMPAWGIRTALVALRTFMAEEGTAGQVGGMEASKDVRQRMASNGRHWKCEVCGGKTNEEIMREWWAICAEKGIKVAQEVGLEELPEGLKLGFKDQIGNPEEVKGATKNTTEPERELAAIKRSLTTAEPARTVIRPNPPPDMSNEASAETSCSSVAPSSSSSSSSSSSDHTTNRKLPTGGPLSEATSISSRSMTAPAVPPAPPVATPILDKAISGLVLALLFMFLKKVIYDPNVIAYDY